MNLYEILIVTSVLCGFAAGLIARAKGRPFVTWFLIGALLNVFALAIILRVARGREMASKVSS